MDQQGNAAKPAARPRLRIILSRPKRPRPPPSLAQDLGGLVVRINVGAIGGTAVESPTGKSSKPVKRLRAIVSEPVKKEVERESTPKKTKKKKKKKKQKKQKKKQKKKKKQKQRKSTSKRRKASPRRSKSPTGVTNASTAVRTGALSFRIKLGGGSPEGEHGVRTPLNAPDAATGTVTPARTNPTRSAAQRAASTLDAMDEDASTESSIDEAEAPLGREDIPGVPGPALPLQPGQRDLKRHLRGLLQKFERRDRHSVFALPVTSDIAPGYDDMIKKPMSLLAMRHKISLNYYNTVDDMVADFDQMILNCTTYNPRDSPFHDIALQVKAACQAVIAETRARVAEEQQQQQQQAKVAAERQRTASAAGDTTITTTTTPVTTTITTPKGVVDRPRRSTSPQSTTAAATPLSSSTAITTPQRSSSTTTTTDYAWSVAAASPLATASPSTTPKMTLATKTCILDPTQRMRNHDRCYVRSYYPALQVGPPPDSPLIVSTTKQLYGTPKAVTRQYVNPHPGNKYTYASPMVAPVRGTRDRRLHYGQCIGGASLPVATAPRNLSNRRASDDAARGSSSASDACTRIAEDQSFHEYGSRILVSGNVMSPGDIRTVSGQQSCVEQAQADARVGEPSPGTASSWVHKGVRTLEACPAAQMFVHQLFTAAPESGRSTETVRAHTEPSAAVADPAAPTPSRVSGASPLSRPLWMSDLERVRATAAPGSEASAAHVASAMQRVLPRVPKQEGHPSVSSSPAVASTSQVSTNVETDQALSRNAYLILALTLQSYARSTLLPNDMELVWDRELLSAFSQLVPQASAQDLGTPTLSKRLRHLLTRQPTSSQ